METYLYLHGFASSPQSAKAKDLSDRFYTCHLSLIVPDLNQDDFTHLTLTRQILQVQSLAAMSNPVKLIGSSLGGLAAAWLGEQQSQVKQLVLLAPAFDFLDHWLPKLGDKQRQQWQRDRLLPIYHYGMQRIVPLSYDFVTDAAQYMKAQLQRPVPTLILHGRQDEVIPIQSSRDYAIDRPWVSLVELNSDHTLSNVLAEIWTEIQEFCQLLD